jgi:hypothetical protein
MNTHLRIIPALAVGLALWSHSALANAEVILNVIGANLVAKGAGVDVSVQITCNNPDPQDTNTAIFGGVLTQRTGNITTSANLGFSQPVICNGTPQDLDILAVVTSPQRVFKQGPAVINISADVMGSFYMDFGSVRKQIQILH